MQISKKGEKALCQRWTFRCIYHMSLSSSVIPLGLGLILFCFGREWGWGVLNHTHVAPAGRIKMHTPRKAIIPATNCLKIIFSLSQLLQFLISLDPFQRFALVEASTTLTS